MQRFKILLFVIYTSLFSFSTKAQVDLSNGLIGYWPLDGNLNDVSGRNRPGTIVGNLTPTTDRIGRFNSAIQLSGNNNYVFVRDTDGSLLPDKFSVCVWFQTTSDRVQTVIGKAIFGQNPINEQFQMYINWPVTPGLGSVIVPQGAPCNLGHTFAESRLFTGSALCTRRWYFMVVTFDNGIHSVYLDGALKATRTVNFSQVTRCIGNLQFGGWWSGDTQYFQGNLDDIRVYNRAINPMEVNALYKENFIDSRYDFSYQQDLCNNRMVSFFYNGPGSEITWDFENGNKGFGRRPVHTFSGNDEEAVSMIVKYDNCTTNDTLTKTINFKVNQAKLLAFNDTTVCENATIQLLSLVNDNFCWERPDGSFAWNMLNPTVEIAESFTYYINHKKRGGNLVKNGDFSLGNTGFKTTYLFRSNNTTEGEYFISPFPQNWNSALSNCFQPNGQVGNMLLVNGVPEANKVVWQQVVPVKKNTTYDFELYITALFPVNPALLQFSINNIIVGDSIQASGEPCTWRLFNTLWNSGNADSALISIVNRNTAVQGNDFAIDDILFSEVIFQRDSVRIKVENGKMEITNDTSICKNSTIQLNAKNLKSVTWFPQTGLSNANSFQPTSTITKTIVYSAHGITLEGCEAEDSVTITALDLPELKLNPDSIKLCRPDTILVSAVGEGKFFWSGAVFVDSNAASTKAFINSTNSVRVTLTGVNQCSITDSIPVLFQKENNFSLVPENPIVCAGDSLLLTAAGGTRYKWVAGSSEFDGPSNRIWLNPEKEGMISVTIINELCDDTATLTTVIGIKPLPETSVTKSNDFDCYNSNVQLIATGGISYLWEQTPGISNISISNPLVNSAAAKTYRVKITGTNGCNAIDSVQVGFLRNAQLRLTGGGVFCLGDSVRLQASGGSFYQWTPIGGLNNPGIANPVAKVILPTVFKVNATTSNGCLIEDSVKVDFFAAGQGAVLQRNLSVCGDKNIQLGAIGGVSYHWQPAGLLNNNMSANPIANITASTKFTVEIKDDNNCSKWDSVFVSWRPTPVFELQFSKPGVCIGDTLVLNALGGNRVNWGGTFQPVSLSGNNIARYRPTSQGVVSALIINDDCKDSAFIERPVVVYPLPSVSVTKSGDWDCNTDAVQLSASGANSYIWSPASGLSSSIVANPIARANQTMQYRVQGSTLEGCSGFEEITINFLNSGNLDGFLFPTAFTPNGDGLNDCIGISKWGTNIKLKIFKIYDRWGNLVFEGSLSKNCWDGRLNNRPMPSGNYMYIVQADSDCGPINQKGSFILIR